MSQIEEPLKEWIALDDEVRELKLRIKILQERKKELAVPIMAYMKSNDVADFTLEESGGSLRRIDKQSKSRMKKDDMRRQLLLTFSDQPQKVGEFLRSMEAGPVKHLEYLNRRLR